MDTGGGLSDVIASLMQNPEIMNMVSRVASESTVKKESVAEEAASESSATSADLTIPPELLSMLPQLMKSLSGSGLLSQGSFGSNTKKRSHSDNQRKALLLALKPFLSEKRCAVIDSLLQFEGLAGVLSAFQNK